MPTTYRITLKGWDRHYGAGHVLDSAKFEVKRRSKKADKESIERLEDMMRRHPPQASDTSAFAWAEVTDAHGYTTTLAKYLNVRGQWDGIVRPGLSSNPAETIQIVYDPRDGGFFDGVFEVDAVERFLRAMSGDEERLLLSAGAPPGHEDEIHVFVEARLQDLGLPLPGEAMGWLRIGESEPYIYQVQARIAQVSVDWLEAARNVMENLGIGEPVTLAGAPDPEDVKEMAALLQESPPAIDLARMFPPIEVRPAEQLPPKGIEWGYHDAQYELESYLRSVEDAFYDAIDTAAEQLYEYARNSLERIDPSQLAVAGEYTETPLAMNADWEASARVAYRGRLTGGQPIEHTLETRADEERKPVIDSALANARDIAVGDVVRHGATEVEVLKLYGPQRGKRAQAEVRDPQHATSPIPGWGIYLVDVTELTPNARRKRKRKKRGVAEHEQETAEERAERLRRQRSEWENVTN
jgi:hypothetical protein